VIEAVADRRAFHLERLRLAVDHATQDRLADLPVAADRQDVAVAGDVEAFLRTAAGVRFDADRIVGLANDNDPLRFDLPAVARHLTRHPHRPVHVPQMHQHRDGDDVVEILRQQWDRRKAFRELVGDEICRQPPLQKAGTGHQRGEEGDVVVNTLDVHLIEGATHDDDRLAPVAAPRRHLGDHRVVEHADLAALVDAAVDAHLGALLRFAIADKAARRRHELAVRILGIDAGFDRPAVRDHRLLLQRQFLAVGDAKKYPEFQGQSEGGGHARPVARRGRLARQPGLPLQPQRRNLPGSWPPHGLGHGGVARPTEVIPRHPPAIPEFVPIVRPSLGSCGIAACVSGILEKQRFSPIVPGEIVPRREAKLTPNAFPKIVHVFLKIKAMQ